ncbi:hypothetical protein B484DRAFT_473801, partial [Ochromonadaceae sp. CCMP2298]
DCLEDLLQRKASALDVSPTTPTDKPYVWHLADDTQTLGLCVHCFRDPLSEFKKAVFFKGLTGIARHCRGGACKNRKKKEEAPLVMYRDFVIFKFPHISDEEGEGNVTFEAEIPAAHVMLKEKIAAFKLTRGKNQQFKVSPSDYGRWSAVAATAKALQNELPKDKDLRPYLEKCIANTV